MFRNGGDSGQGRYTPQEESTVEDHPEDNWQEERQAEMRFRFIGGPTPNARLTVRGRKTPLEIGDEVDLTEERVAGFLRSGFRFIPVDGRKAAPQRPREEAPIDAPTLEPNTAVGAETEPDTSE